MLEIKNLHVTIDKKEILKGLNLTIKAGETHAIMGPNGAGKSTLSNVIAGDHHYEVTKGSIIYKGKDLLELETHERAAEGIFLAFQYPVEIPGINTMSFLKTALNAVRKHHRQDPIDALEFLTLIKEKMKLLNITDDMLKRALNVGFSGGEKKRNEILQMAVLNPDLAILDETDSGLDIDALQLVAQGVNKLKNKDNARLVITHYQRLLNYIIPDYVHILLDGKIVESGGKELALKLEEKGYANFTSQKAS